MYMYMYMYMYNPDDIVSVHVDVHVNLTHQYITENFTWGYDVDCHLLLLFHRIAKYGVDASSPYHDEDNQAGVVTLLYNIIIAGDEQTRAWFAQYLKCMQQKVREYVCMEDTSPPTCTCTCTLGELLYSVIIMIKAILCATKG